MLGEDVIHLLNNANCLKNDEKVLLLHNCKSAQDWRIIDMAFYNGCAYGVRGNFL